MRKNPSSNKKRGYIVIPIFHHIEENLEQEIKKKPIFNFLIQVVRAMCDQDERLEAEINEIASKKGKRSNAKLLIDFNENDIEKIIRLEGLEKKLQNVLFDEIIEKTKDYWQVMFLELLAFKKEHNHIEVSRNQNKQLKNWIYEQRRKNRAKKLHKTKRKKLDSIGFDWKSEEFREESSFDDIWLANYQKLIEYHKEKGDCDIPARYSKDKSLGTWVVAQRAQKRKGALDQTRIDLLEELDFSWDARVKIFEQFCLRLIEYKNKYGHTEVPTISNDYPKLGKWTNKYRSILNNGETNNDGSITYAGSSLKKGQIEKLYSLGFKKTVRKTDWNESFKELKEFFEEHGDSNPTHSESNYLYYWCYRNRKNKAKLTIHQINQLESLNFDFSINNKHKYSRKGSNQNWNERFLELELFYEENEHFNLTEDNEEFEGLYNWLKYQRKVAKKGELSEDKHEKLKSLGLDFNIHFLSNQEQDWENKFSDLVNYFNIHNTFYIATNDKKNGSLLSWIRYQRSLYRNEKLSEDKKLKLLEIGYSFTHKFTSDSNYENNSIWLSKLEQLKTYHKKNHTFLIPKTDKQNNHLIPWIQYQKKLKREGKISPFKESKLLAIGYSFSIDYRKRKPSNSIQSEKSKVIWDIKFKELSDYFTATNSFIIPSNNKSLQSLKSWLQYQKNLYKKGLLSEDKIHKIKSIGYSFDLDFRGKKQEISISNDLVWLERLKELNLYKSEYNTFLISKNLPQYSHLKKWLIEQKRLFKKGNLSESKRTKLNEIGYDFNLNYQGKIFAHEINPSLKQTHSPKSNKRQITWETNYLELINYKVKYGHCNVKRSFENKSLANFVAKQRQLYKKGILNSDKKEKLQLLDFEFEGNKSNAWNIKYEELRLFYEKYGHCHYKKSDENSSIYNWILNQRVYRKKGKLSNDKIEKLNKIKFIWEALSTGSSPKEDEWFNRLLELKKYKDKFGDTNVSQLDPNYKSLGRWVNDQRVAKKGRKISGGKIVYLSNERQSLLNDLGFVWDMKEFEWDKKVELLASFYKENRHFNVKQKEKGYEGLYYWLFKVQKSGATNERLQKLRKIGYNISEIKIITK